MDIKGFLRPTLGKVGLFAILMGGLNYLWISGTYVEDTRILVGLPLGFWPVGSFGWIPVESSPTVEFSAMNFGIDIMFWYLISCIILFAYNAKSKAAAEKTYPVK